jgi:hypothetical protein
MRMPLVVDFTARDSDSGNDARLTNTLQEQRIAGKMVGKRPGLTSLASPPTAAVGNGLVCFNGALIGVAGGQLLVGTSGTLTAIGSVTSSIYDLTLGSP